MPKMHTRVWTRYVAMALVAAAGCTDNRAPTQPAAPSAELPSFSVEYYNGWEAWVESDNSSDGYMITCPTPIQGIGPVYYQSRWWNSANGPYVAITRTLTKTRYGPTRMQPPVFVSTDGARATCNWFEVSCKSLLGFPMFDLMSFTPSGWFVTYEPPPPGGGDGGGDGGECETQLVDDPSQPCPGGDGGGGGGGGGGDGDDGGDDGGGGGGEDGCYVDYIIIEISYDGGETWHTWWEGEARVCV